MQGNLPIYKFQALSYCDPIQWQILQKKKTLWNSSSRSFQEGKFSQQLENGLKAGDNLQVHGPYGELRIRLSHRNIIMVAGGSGLAPLLSMLYQLAEKGNERPVQFFFGARTDDDLYYIKEIEAVQQHMPALEFIPVLSESWPCDWRGETGLVTEAISRYRDSFKNYDAYLCGPPPYD